MEEKTLKEILEDEGVEKIKLHEIRALRPKIDGNEKALSYDEVLNEMKVATGFSKADIKTILDTYFDLAKRELITRGTFRIPEVVSIKTTFIKGQIVWDERKGFLLQYPDSAVLRPRISQKIKKMYRYARRHEMNGKFNKTIRNWYEPFIISDQKPVDVRVLDYGKNEEES